MVSKSDSNTAAADSSSSTDPDEQNEGARLEKLISSLGQFGRYQRYVMFLSCVGSFMPGMVVVAMTFLAYEPDHRCQVPQCEPYLNMTSYNETFLNFTTPYDKANKRWSRCDRYHFTAGHEFSEEEVDSFSCSRTLFSNATEPCGEGHVFDDSFFRSSIITDFGLWCSTPFYRSLAGMAYMAGMLIGAITLGDLADRIGRRNGVVLSCTILGVFGIVSACAPNYPVFLLARFLTGAGAVGLFQITFVLAVEFIGAKHRTFVGIMIEVPFALGEAMTGVLAYFIRDWRYLQLAVTVPALLIISYRWIMPESVRWLVSQNRTEEAIAILKKMAKINKKELLEEKLVFIRDRTKIMASEFESTRTSTVDLVTNEASLSDTPNGDDSTEKEPKKTVFDLLRTPNMRARSLNMFFCWAVVTFMYYGLSLNSSNIGNNVFVSFILTMLIEIPSYVFAWLALDRMGRKGTVMLMFMLGGISCILSGTLPKEMATTIMIMSLIGKFGAAAAFAIVYVYASEIFPTDYRGVGVGSCSMFARVGGMLAPLVVEMFQKAPWVTPVVFGVLGCLCGLLVIMLPETVGVRLPQTIQESEDFGGDQKMTDCCFCITQRKRRKVEDSSAGD